MRSEIVRHGSLDDVDAAPAVWLILTATILAGGSRAAPDGMKVAKG